MAFAMAGDGTQPVRSVLQIPGADIVSIATMEVDLKTRRVEAACRQIARADAENSSVGVRGAGGFPRRATGGASPRFLVLMHRLLPRMFYADCPLLFYREPTQSGLAGTYVFL